jgi:FkbM family methyltransferase
MNFNRINKFLKDNNLKIIYVDVGAREDLSGMWKKMENNLNVIGFESDPVETQLLNKKYPLRKYYPFGLWSSKKKKDLYITLDPSSSSLYKPNLIRNALFKDSYHNFRKISKKISVDCDTIDSVNLKKIDFLKIDTQGSEFEILAGATKLLINNIPLVTCETWTSEIYEKTPLMHKIIELMYDNGYEILDMELCHSSKHKNDIESFSKAISGGYEILFYKNNIDYKADQNSIIKHILLLDLFGYRDLAMHVCDKYIQGDKFIKLKDYLLESSSIKYNKLEFIKKTLRKFNINLLYKLIFKSNYIKMNQ